MTEKRRRLSDIGTLYRDFSFSIGAQAALIALDLIANGIKLVLAYVYFYLFDHIQALSFKTVAWVGVFTLLVIGVSQGAMLAYSALHERCLQNRLLQVQRDLFTTHSGAQLSSLEQCKAESGCHYWEKMLKCAQDFSGTQ